MPADKDLAGEELETFMASLGADFRRPDRKDEPPRFGSLGTLRQWIESDFWTCKGQFTLERHGDRNTTRVAARIVLRVLALAVTLWHNWEIGEPGRHLAPNIH